MKQITQFEQQNILILGLAKSGFAAAKLLKKLGATITVNDGAPLEGNEAAQSLLDDGFEVICGSHPIELLERPFDLIVKNPGIPYTNPIVESAQSLGIPVWTEIELAYLISEAPIIAITGSNGKTTTTTLLYHILNVGQKNPLIAGNIGTVSCTVAEEATADDIIVLEASSFQLMGTENFKPKVSILTNLYDAHLDYHGDFEAYSEAKAHITLHQDEEDYFIYNADQQFVREIAERTKAKKIPFSTNGKTLNGISADDELIYWNGEAILERKFIKLPGQHNLENILSAVAAAKLFNCEDTVIEEILSSFTGVKHRMQFVKEHHGRKYYNDSKATNTLATKSALSAFTVPTILIAGGLDRGQSFEELRDNMEYVKAVVAVGETKEKFLAFAKSCGIDNAVLANSMEEAVAIAQSYALPEEVVLLSPASASWDEYPSFEIRGDRFIEAVQNVTRDE